jgi:RNase P/RNase MRP subunit POP5
MVRFKKRYFVVQFDREKDLYDSSIKKQNFKPRALQDSRPLDIRDDVLALAVKDIVEHIHGDFGRAAITTGLRAIYSNPETHLALIQCRHGPHRLVGSSLPFLTKINDERLVPRLVYTGATIKNCFKVKNNSIPFFIYHSSLYIRFATNRRLILPEFFVFLARECKPFKN